MVASLHSGKEVEAKMAKIIVANEAAIYRVPDSFKKFNESILKDLNKSERNYGTRTGQEVLEDFEDFIYPRLLVVA